MSKGQGWFTIPELFVELGYEPSKNETWSAGNQARDVYMEVTGQLPPKGLRTKTCGIGSHCFAVYPSEWRPRLEGIIRGIASQAARQPRMF